MSPKLNITNKLKGNGELKPLNPDIDEKTYYVNPGLKEDLEGIVATILNIDKFGTEMGHRNFLLKGPPGTGKTLGVGYLATKLECPVYDGKNLSTAQQISNAYNQLREATKNSKNGVILMLDEVDRYASREEVVDAGQQQALNQLLVEMDGTASNNGIFVFGMTNKPDKIDNALRRPGRFSKEIEFMPPNKDGRLAILNMHADGKGGHQFKVQGYDLEDLSKMTFGYTGADLRGLLDEAFTKAILRDSTEVTKSDLEFALKRIKPSALRDMPFREPSRKLVDVGGYELHKEIMRKVLSNEGGSMDLFYGPSGAGKTDFAEALAGEFRYNFIVVSGSEPEDKYVGETGKKIEKYLTRAKQLAPCILLFDEMDALIEKQGVMSHKSSWTGLLQSKLSKLIEGVHIIGTMNRPDLINNTFLQRFPQKLYFGMPSKEEQVEIWEKYVSKGINVNELIKTNSHLTGRDISRAVQMIGDYGVDETTEIYKHLIQNIKPVESVDYEKMRETIGDSVKDYQGIKKFLINKGEKKK